MTQSYDKLLAKLKTYHKSKSEVVIEAYRLGYLDCKSGVVPCYSIEDEDVEMFYLTCPLLKVNISMRLLRIGQDRINPYDCLGRLLGCIAILNMLDALLRYKLCTMAFSHQFFEVLFPSKAVICEMSVRLMEGTVFSGIPLGWISLQGWWSLHQRIVFHLG
ncbi:unnamed protein product [Prunus armeniaca]